MTIFQSIVLGLIQGLTELLPISSSAHLNLIPWILTWNIPESFDVALHFGTLLAIGIFFFMDWINLIKCGVNQIVGKKSNEGKLFWYFVIATIPGAIIGFVLDRFFEECLKAPIIIAFSLIIMGIILYVVDKYSKNETKYENLTLKQTFLVGLSQCLAFIPGVSRSGITMTTARLLRIDRESSAKFSFMLATPIIFGATLLKLSDFVFNMEFIIGVLVSFIVGIFVIKYLLEFLKKGTFKCFAIYRIVVGILAIIIFFVR